MRRLLVAGVLLVTAGCTATESGTPTAGGTTTATATTTTGSSGTSETTTTTGGTSVTRPANLDMSAVNPCQVLAALPVANWGLAAGSSQGGESSLFPGSQDCFGQGDNIGLTIVAVRDQGATDYIEGANAEVTDSTVAGYPLYVLKPSDPSNCFGAVDVNDGQMLFLNYGVSIPGDQPDTPQTTLCQRIPDIATATLGVIRG